jgi:U4/U6.U5 tri-snRNP-associated protein 3
MRLLSAVGVSDVRCAFGEERYGQGKEVKDDNCKVSAVHKKSKRSARQYMNRRGGFNRPLPPERTGEKVNDF